MNVLETIINRRDRRDWTTLPSSFEHDAVRAAFADIKPLFGKQDIKARIKASKATTFQELREAIALASSSAS